MIRDSQDNLLEFERERPPSLLRKPTVSALFHAALSRTGCRLDRSPFRGKLFSDNGRHCRFAIDVGNGRVENVQFRASPCISLVAYCEWVSQRLEQKPLSAALMLTRRDLIEGVPEIRPDRHLRADLALRAVLSACARAEAFEARYNGATSVDALAWAI